MAPLLVLVPGWLLFRTAGKLGVEQFSSWRSAGRGATAGMFLFTGATHFSSMKHDYAAMIPEPLPKSLRLIHVTGLLQIAGAIGLLIRPLRRLAGIGLAAQLVAMFPANAYAAREGIPFRGRAPTPLALRAPVQLAALSNLPAWTACGLTRVAEAQAWLRARDRRHRWHVFQPAHYVQVQASR